MQTVASLPCKQLFTSTGRRPSAPHLRLGNPRVSGSHTHWPHNVKAGWTRQAIRYGHAVVASLSAPAAGYSAHKWLWRDHKINYLVAGCGEPVVLIHGFGASGGQFRQTIQILSQKYKVYALDLLGFGGSEKPEIPYTMEVWQEQVADFLNEFVDQPAVLIGNSIGSLTSLMTAAAAPQRIRGVVLLNTAGAMNNKGILNDWRIMLVYPIFLLIDILLSIRPVAEWLFERIRSRENIKTALSNIYCNPAMVDDELVEMFYKPSEDAGALHVFVSVITGPPGPKPWDLVQSITAPLLILWGDRDTLTPVDGPVGRYFTLLPQSRPQTTFELLEGDVAMAARAIA